jgi:hypothetical protein
MLYEFDFLPGVFVSGFRKGFFMWRIRILIPLLVVSASQVLADAPVTKDSFVRDTILSPDWSCHYLEKRILDVPADGSVDSVGPLCKATVKCVGATAALKGNFRKSLLTCRTITKNACPDVRTCGLEQISESREFDIDNAPVVTFAKESGPDKFGRTCQYKDPKTSGLTFWTKAGKKVGYNCNNRVKCTSPKGDSEPIVTCPANVKVNATSGSEEVSCPQYYDCAATDKSRPGYTEAEIEDFKRRGIPVTH